MRKKKMLFIYNPCAGKGAMKSKLSDVMETFMRADYEVTVYATQREREATELVMELGEKYDRIVCSGGDGTLHEVTQGLMNMPAESRPVCGYIPTGTVNDFARGLKLPTRVRNAAKTAVGRQNQTDGYRSDEWRSIYVCSGFWCIYIRFV